MQKKEFIQEYLNYIFENLGVKPTLSIYEENSVIEVEISGEELNFLIGTHGDCLYSLQHLLGLALFNEYKEWVDFSIDINGYRKGRVERIQDITKNFIDKVRFFKKDIDMPPMNSYERKIVHEFVSEYDDIVTESVGEGYARYVILRPKNS